MLAHGLAVCAGGVREHRRGREHTGGGVLVGAGGVELEQFEPFRTMDKLCGDVAENDFGALHITLGHGLFG